MHPVELLSALKRSFRSGNVKIQFDGIMQIAHSIGIKSKQVVQNHINTLEKEGLLTYKNGHLWLRSLRKRFPRFRKLIRLFSDQPVREVLFSGVVKYFKSRNRFIATHRGKSRKQSITSVRAFTFSESLDGLSLSYLSKLLGLTRQRISQLKDNPFLTITHQFEKVPLSYTDMKVLTKFGDSFGKYKPGVFVSRNGQVWRQKVDKINVAGIELSCWKPTKQK